MLNEWRTFLASQGARFEGDAVRDFGNPDQEAQAAVTGNVVTDLSFLTVIRISGTAAATVLDREFTLDVERMTDGAPQLGAWCNSAGRVFTSFIIVKFGDDFFLVLPEEMSDRFVRRFARLLSSADITLEDCSRTVHCIGYRHVDGNKTNGAELARRLWNQQRAIRQNGLVMLHLPANWNRVIIFGPPPALEVAWLNLVPTYRVTGSQYWQLFDVFDGLPWIVNATTEALSPQVLGLYPLGRATTAQMRNRGGGRRRLFIVILDAESGVLPGAKLYASAETQNVGLIVNVSVHPTAGFHVLAVLDVDYCDQLEALRLEHDQVQIRKIIAPPLR